MPKEIHIIIPIWRGILATEEVKAFHDAYKAQEYYGKSAKLLNIKDSVVDDFGDYDIKWIKAEVE